MRHAAAALLVLLLAFRFSPALAAEAPPGAKPPPVLTPQGRALALRALQQLQARLDLVQEQLAQRAYERSLVIREQVSGVLVLLPLVALLFVPVWLWRRGALRRAREAGVPPRKATLLAIVATLSVTALLFVFVQAFVFLEEVKTVFSWASPSVALQMNALEYTVKQGAALIEEGSPLVGPLALALRSGTATADNLLSNLLANAERIQSTWAFRFGYRLYEGLIPFLEHVGQLLIVITFFLFLRFSLPGVRELLAHVSGEGPPGRGFGRTLLRYIGVEIRALSLFLLPYLILTVVSVLITFWVTDTGAHGIVENVVNAASILMAREVSPQLVVANFIGMAIFMIEIVLLLILVSALLLASSMQVLHEKFFTGRSFWSYRRYVLHFFRLLFRLYASVAIVVIPLDLLLDWLSDHRDTLGPTATLLLPYMLVVLLNLGLWALRFFKALRRVFDRGRWEIVSSG